MNILVIGSNGREHVLANTYAKSKKVKNVFIAPGNGLTDFTNKKIKNVPIEMTDLEKLIAFAKKQKVEFVDVPQDDCIAKGYVDAFIQKGISAFGPSKNASKLEWSKKWAREFMEKYKLPIPHYKSFNSVKDAEKYLNQISEQLVFIKASGLALGKGVIRAENKKEALLAIKQMGAFGTSGKTFLIEEGLVGEEFSLFVITDGKSYVITKPAQDHKTVFDHDQGPNTGGMGSVAPTNALTQRQIKEIEKTIVKPTLTGMEKEGRIYKGILYIGGIITKQGIKIIEFNARWGDPEAEVILPSLQTDYVEVAQAVIKQKLQNARISFDAKVRISVAACAYGYPTDYKNIKGKEIFGIFDAMKIKGVTFFGSGIKRLGKRFFVNGGRVFYIVAEGKNIKEARHIAYSAMSMIYVEGNNLHYRTDIGWRDVERII